MMLIADSGSTKTDWVLIGKGCEVHAYTTQGINPYFLKTEDIVKIIANELKGPKLPESILEVHFYGAGCSSLNKSKVVMGALQEAFNDSAVYVESDLLGAARALLNNEEGLAAILGTGSNSCHFDGEQIIQNVPSLGYVLGDEGSGAYLGKILLQAYMTEQLSKDLQLELSSFCNLSKEAILDALYKKPLPNRFLASFSPFLSKQGKHPIIKKIVTKSFSDFFDAHILKYPSHNSLKVGFVGSVSYCFQDILNEVAKTKNVQLGKILKSPIEGLVAYHT